MWDGAQHHDANWFIKRPSLAIFVFFYVDCPGHEYSRSLNISFMGVLVHKYINLAMMTSFK